MAAVDLGGLIQVGYAVLRTTVSAVTGKIQAQLGDVRGEAETDNADWVQQPGFISRPPKAQKGKAAAYAVVVKGGDRDTVVGAVDLRGLELAGLINDGDTVVYAAGEEGTSQGRVALKGDGSVTLFTTDDNTNDGKSVYMRVAPDGFMWVAPWGTIRFDATGFHVLHDSGAAFDLGGINGLPAPLDVISSYIKMRAGTIGGASSVTSFGGNGKPLASASDVFDALANLQSQINAIANAFTSFAAMSAAPTVTGSALAAASAPVPGVVAQGAAVTAAAQLTLPTTTSST